MAVGLADPDAGGLVIDYVAEQAGRLVLVVALVAVVLVGVIMVATYRVGYADGVRASAPLAAPPTKTERAR